MQDNQKLRQQARIPNIISKQRTIKKQSPQKNQLKLHKLTDSENQLLQAVSTSLVTKKFDQKNQSQKQLQVESNLVPKQNDLNKSYDRVLNWQQAQQFKLESGPQIPICSENLQVHKQNMIFNEKQNLKKSVDILQQQQKNCNQQNDYSNSVIQLPSLNFNSQNFQDRPTSGFLNQSMKRIRTTQQKKKSHQHHDLSSSNIQKIMNISPYESDKSPQVYQLKSSSKKKSDNFSKQVLKKIKHKKIQSFQKALETQQDQIKQQDYNWEVQSPLDTSQNSCHIGNQQNNRDLQLNFSKKRSKTPDFAQLEDSDTSGNSQNIFQLQSHTKFTKTPNPTNCDQLFSKSPQQDNIKLAKSQPENNQQVKKIEIKKRTNLIKNKIHSVKSTQPQQRKQQEGLNQTNQLQKFLVVKSKPKVERKEISKQWKKDLQVDTLKVRNNPEANDKPLKKQRSKSFNIKILQEDQNDVQNFQQQYQNNIQQVQTSPTQQVQKVNEVIHYKVRNVIKQRIKLQEDSNPNNNLTQITSIENIENLSSIGAAEIGSSPFQALTPQNQLPYQQFSSSQTPSSQEDQQPQEKKFSRTITTVHQAFKER